MSTEGKLNELLGIPIERQKLSTNLSISSKVDKPSASVGRRTKSNIANLLSR
jgi:hypothetical protein